MCYMKNKFLGKITYLTLVFILVTQSLKQHEIAHIMRWIAKILGWTTDLYIYPLMHFPLGCSETDLLELT